MLQRFKRVTVTDVIAWTVLGLAMTAALLPIAWTLLNSFKLTRDIGAYPPVLIFEPTIAHYLAVLDAGAWAAFMNSVITTTGAVALTLVTGVPAGYALARFQGASFKVFGLFFLSLRFMPAVTFILPLFLMYISLNLTGTLIGLIVAYQVFLLPISVWITWGFFAQIPPELEEAARVDGCSWFGAFFRVTLPNARAGVISTAVIATIFAWNEFLTPTILGARAAETMPLRLTRFIGGEEVVAQWGPMAAFSIIVVAPVLIIALALNRYVVAGFIGSQGRR